MVLWSSVSDNGRCGGRGNAQGLEGLDSVLGAHLDEGYGIVQDIVARLTFVRAFHDVESPASSVSHIYSHHKQ